tara:strand:+ start:176 stop:499 length:324 start_codon:yes stop_codon:yes gene_type:complete
VEQRGIMKNNKKAYRIYMALSAECRKILSLEYQIEKVENTENKKWNNRFLYNFWNWLWMTKFKHAPQSKTMELVKKIENFNARCMKVRAMGITPKEIKKLSISGKLH